MKFAIVALIAGMACLSSSAIGASTDDVGATDPSKQSRVILVTVDGVGARDIFGDPGLRAQWEALPGRLWGEPGTVPSVRVANPYLLSLPGYQSLTVGQVTACSSNSCGRVKQPTLFDRVAREIGADAVAVFGSWVQIEKAVTHLRPGKADRPQMDIGIGTRKRNATDPPWSGARWDAQTWSLAREYWLKQDPRLLWVALDDSDEYGHRGMRAEYEQSVREYAVWLRMWLADLALDAGRDARTTVIVTTDHGRGKGPDSWRSHHSGLPEAAEIWAWVSTPAMRAGRREEASDQWPSAITHLDFRPTIEKILGLEPTLGRRRGQVIESWLDGGMESLGGK